MIYSIGCPEERVKNKQHIEVLENCLINLKKHLKNVEYRMKIIKNQIGVISKDSEFKFLNEQMDISTEYKKVFKDDFIKSYINKYEGKTEESFKDWYFKPDMNISLIYEKMREFLNLLILNHKARITICRRKYYYSWFAYMHKDHPKILYVTIYAILSLTGFLVLTLKYSAYGLNIFDLAEPTDYLFGGLMSPSIWISTICILTISCIIHKIKLEIFTSLEFRPIRRVITNLLYSVYRNKWAFVTPIFILFFTLPILPYLLTKGNSMVDIRKILFPNHYEVGVAIKGQTKLLGGLSPIYKLSNYHIFKSKSSAECTPRIVVIPNSNISAILKKLQSNEQPPSNDERNIDKSNEITICALNTDSPIKNASYDVTLNSQTLMELKSIYNQYQEPNDKSIEYLQNYLNQTKELSQHPFRIIRELSTIYFNNGDSSVNTAAEPVIKKLASQLKHKQLHLVIVGYANAIGRKESNFILSIKRANAVKNGILNEMGLQTKDRFTHESTIRTHGVGENFYDIWQSEEGPTHRRARVFIVEFVKEKNQKLTQAKMNTNIE